MKHVKKILTVILSLAIAIVLVPVMSTKLEIEAEDSFAITSPGENALVAAGHFDVEWNEATGTAVKNYTVYLDGQKAGSTTSTSYECYTTKVSMHQLYVVAEYSNGDTKTTATVNFGVSKKGLGLATDMGANISLKNMGCSWYYNWGTGPSSGQQYKGIEYVPMVWKSTNATGFKNQVNNFKNQGYKYVLTFNEPDLSGQCDMTVDEVYNVWQGIDDVTGINVSSPVTAIWPKASTAWFQTFMNKIDLNNDHDVDFISIHCYPDNYGGAGMADWFLEEVVDWTWETYHKPIWITEFSTSGSGITATGGNGTKEFWERVMPGLDSREYVERYAAFDFNSETTGLWLYDSGELTPAGEVYRDQGNPEGYEATPEEAPDFTYSFSTKNTLLEDSVTVNQVTCEDYIHTDGVTAVASSAINNNSDADKAIDEDISSRWESQQKVDPQTLTIDLGQVRDIKQIGIIWEAASAKEYKIEVSTDGVNFTEVALVEDGNGNQNRFDTIQFKEMVQGRYVRINGISRTTDYGYSIYDLAVYGTTDQKVDETTVAPTTTKETAKPTVAPTTSKETAKTTTKGNNSASTKVAETISASNTSATKKEAGILNKDTSKVTLGKTYVKTATKKKSEKKIKITLKRIKGAQKYQIQVCNTKKFKKNLVKKTVKKIEVTLKSNKLRKKKLYVRARAMSVVGKNTYYGNWSMAKRVKIRK